ncbi:guanylate-binding protein 1 isoform X2 [Bombina bombina]|uniref:guanylate-binding protein 1 isoform X2 n=1 Tax=Bombina bombina TaxID=8345 RepID=UPI00235B1933|nr:guanylate-binding protein 1 isoform X2 [Bombina bombina]
MVLSSVQFRGQLTTCSYSRTYKSNRVFCCRIAFAVMDLPVCLIENQEGNKLVVNKKALQILHGINQPVVVVAIVGKYRTGKSYLMNKLAGQRKGFALGSTVESKTKGIWMWCVPHPTMADHTLVLLDTEGLGDVQKGDSKNDAWIFSLAVLLSSTLIYNSVGTIDQQAMDQLHYVTELTELIKVKSPSAKEINDEDDGADFKRVFPSFIWCVRDFTLSLEVDGKSITEDDYLQNSLMLKRGTSKKVQEYNLPRECIRHYFHSHKCFVFDRPADKEGLNKLDQIPESQLEPDFLHQTEKFLSYVYKNSQIKTLAGGYPLNGRLLGNLALTYVEAILSGSVPCMENAVLTLAKLENSRAVTEAVSKYESKMNEQIDQFPTETQEDFLKLHQESEKEAVKIFMNQSFKDENQEFQAKLIELLLEKQKEYSQSNEMASIKKCRTVIQQLSMNMEKRILEGYYSKPGGHKYFAEDKQKLIDEYHQSQRKGVKALEVLQEFLKEKENVETAILQADQSLTDKEKQIKEQRAQAEAANREKQILEENKKCLEKQMEDQKRSFKEQEEMMLQKMEEERKKIIAENEWLIKEKLKEQEAMLKEGFNKQCDMLSDQINSLRRQNEEASRGSIFGDILSAVLPGAVGQLFGRLLK